MNTRENGLSIEHTAQPATQAEEIAALMEEAHAAEERVWIAAIRYLLDLKLKHVTARSAVAPSEYEWLTKQLRNRDDGRTSDLEQVLELDWAPYTPPPRA